jgi:hypothetical protein
MTPLIYAKWGGIAAALLAWSWACFHQGGLGPTAALDRAREAQAELVARAVLAERASTAAESVRVNAILKGYEDAPIDPIVPGVAHRVLVYAGAAGCPVSGAAAAPSGAGGPSPRTPGDPGLERLFQALIDACAQDASELTALQQAWPLTAPQQAWPHEASSP